ncbi:hypothetical protein, partial [Enterobacter asburiae]
SGALGPLTGPLPQPDTGKKNNFSRPFPHRFILRKKTKLKNQTTPFAVLLIKNEPIQKHVIV